MDLKNKEKIVKVVGAAETALIKLEENVNLFEAQGNSGGFFIIANLLDI